MADEDTTTTDSTEEEEVKDDDQQVDESSQDESEADDTTTDDQSDDEETDEDESDDDSSKDDGGFTKRFTQIKGDSPEEYLKNLEETYVKSSTESVRLNRQVRELSAQVEKVTKLVAQNPELAEKLKTDTATTSASEVNPALAFAESEMNRKWQEEYQGFVKLHPEVETDPELAEQLDEQLKIVRDVVWARENRLLGMGEGLTKAWKLLDRDEAPTKEDKVRSAVKDQASQSKTGGTVKPEGKTKFTDKQIEIHMEIANVDRKTAIKQLSEYAT